MVMEKMKDDDEFEDHFPKSPLTKSPTPDRSSDPATASSTQSPSSSDHSSSFTENDDGKNQKTKLQRKRSSFVYRISEHVKMGPKLSETVKGKLSVGAKIIKNGGRENIVRGIFGMEDGEKLLKASQCYISTTWGPIAGILFITTLKVAFCSERSITVHSSSDPPIIRTPYKLSIPVKKIKGGYESENVNNPAQRYIEIVTRDNFEFWFMGFVRYEKAFMNLQKAISMSGYVDPSLEN